MCIIKRFFFTIIQLVLLLDNTNLSKVGQAIGMFKAIGKTIKSPLLKTIGNTIKKPIIKTFGNSMKNSVNNLRRSKKTIKTFACGLQEKYLRIGGNVGSMSVKYLGGESTKKFKYMVPQAIRANKQLFRAEIKKNAQMGSNSQMKGDWLSSVIKRSAGQMKGKEFGSLINMASKSKPQLPFLFAAGSLERATQFNIKRKNTREWIEEEELANMYNYPIPEGADKVLGAESIVGPFTKEQHKRTQIYLSGMSMTNISFDHIFEDKKVTPVDKDFRVRLITAPLAYITLCEGATLTAWFDLKKEPLLNPDFYDINDVERSSKLIKTVIDEEVEKLGGKSENVYLIGHSQGLAMALHVGLRYEKTLGGIMGLGGFKFKESTTHKNNEKTPILLVHGGEDHIHPVQKAVDTYNYNGWGKAKNILFHEYRYLGTVPCMETLQQYKDFINATPEKPLIMPEQPDYDKPFHMKNYVKPTYTPGEGPQWEKKIEERSDEILNAESNKNEKPEFDIFEAPESHEIIKPISNGIEKFVNDQKG